MFFTDLESRSYYYSPQYYMYTRRDYGLMIFDLRMTDGYFLPYTSIIGTNIAMDAKFGLFSYTCISMHHDV